MRIHLVANEGEIWTNGTIYGARIYLAEGADDKDFYKISRAEYEEMLKKQEEMMGGNN